MVKTPKVTASEFQEALQGLRVELQEQFHGLAELVQARSAMASSEASAPDFSAAFARLRTELRSNPQLVELSEQLQAAVKDSQMQRQEVLTALQGLRDEFRRSHQELAKAQAGLQLSSESTEANWADVSQAIQNLRDELSRRTGELSELVASGQLHAETDREAAAAAIQSLRAEVHEDVESLQRSVGRSPPRSSPLVPALTGLAALTLGALATGWYYESNRKEPTQIRQFAALDPKIENTLGSHSLLLSDLKNTLHRLETDATEGTSGGGVESLRQAVADLHAALAEGQKKFDADLQRLRDELLPADRTTVARPALPGSEAAPAAGAAEKVAARPAQEPVAEVPDAAAKPEGTQSVLKTAADTPPTPADATPVKTANEARLVIRNPSPFDLKLLVNGEPVDVAARGDTTVPVTKGRVKTQFASLPDLVQYWEDWQQVEGHDQLTIRVDWQGDTYKLQ